MWLAENPAVSCQYLVRGSCLFTQASSAHGVPGGGTGCFVPAYNSYLR